MLGRIAGPLVATNRGGARGAATVYAAARTMAPAMDAMGKSEAKVNMSVLGVVPVMLPCQRSRQMVLATLMLVGTTLRTAGGAMTTAAGSALIRVETRIC